MQRWELIDRGPVPGGGELHLFKRGDGWSIMLAGGGELMGSRSSGSEQALARLGCAPVAGRATPRVLVGGLGMGFTLAAALAVLPAGAEVVVAELVPTVLAWNRDLIGAVAGHPLHDPRTRVFEGDVADAIGDDSGAWDAILLDVDNGPHGLTAPANDRLYARRGLRRTLRALRPGGVLTVWSAQVDERFTARLAAAGFAVELRTERAHAGRGGRYVVWVATAAG